jgi:hypothetical protein
MAVSHAAATPWDAQELIRAQSCLLEALNNKLTAYHLKLQKYHVGILPGTNHPTPNEAGWLMYEYQK